MNPNNPSFRIYVKCNACGCVHFSKSRQSCLDEIKQSNEYYNSLSKEKKVLYYGGKPPSLNDYKLCHRCNGSYKNFSDAEDNDCPNGSTINPILSRHE